MKYAQFFRNQKNKRSFLKFGHRFVQETVIFGQCQKNRVSLTMTEWVREKTNLIRIQKHTQSTSKKLMDFSMEPLQMVNKAKQRRKKHDESCLNLGFHHFKSLKI